ncbi:hypothetical protein AB6A40_007216 [Gnathostoma spinigerum]|uniref:Methyltransferase type 11 domain-containing protein n=1 Tax=Gnathostoma spinigerum TaxID=75299 RepID=A0ABD6EUZ1_9BILA
MRFEEAQQSFFELLDSVEPQSVPEFLQWINDSFAVDTGDRGISVINKDENICDSTNVVEANAVLRSIAADIRNELPCTAVLPSENLHWPKSGTDSDIKPETTVHVDSFLYEDDEVDNLVEIGKLSRDFCTQCGSRDIKPLTFISHSLSVDQLRYIFVFLVPLNATMTNRIIIDIGSRLGAVLYAAFLYSRGRIYAVGIELNSDFCRLQEKILNDNGMSERVKVINDDLRGQSSLISQGDVLVMNNVFNFFLAESDQLQCWSFLYENVRGGAVIVSNPSLEEATSHLQLPFKLQDWVDKVDTNHLAARFAGTNEDLFDDVKDICLYSVKHRDNSQ